MIFYTWFYLPSPLSKGRDTLFAYVMYDFAINMFSSTESLIKGPGHDISLYDDIWSGKHYLTFGIMFLRSRIKYSFGTSDSVSYFFISPALTTVLTFIFLHSCFLTMVIFVTFSLYILGTFSVLTPCSSGAAPHARRYRRAFWYTASLGHLFCCLGVLLLFRSWYFWYISSDVCLLCTYGHSGTAGPCPVFWFCSVC